VAGPDEVREARREASAARRALRDAEAEIERVETDHVEAVADLTARIASARDRAIIAEAKLEVLT
jgi:predicted  nucleic acid-binding Zn-ribbon protein